ncbi:hypothetical protein SMGD1_1939 [Sulfurimonas gotlandica GD1]|uniref:Integral membrane protein n=1 Tax=Sulfurimonas gotlandica (strain DSM 19862 / JCM 16533 / GD1) TaxID=929558 RepID=B6BIV2_SULGG|nr:hypothetical protein [Sulfurimonas gotlandica]EDZ62960.1 putative integral membrane protein [Sulfurimonas gotlandica GD1]EHP30462.1 hypothetical protein SMGD1_1939 [Sulfurimonas gotlandica GD1]
MSHRFVLFSILGIDAFILFFQTSSLSISHAESMILYGDFSFLQLIIKTSLYFFGSNDFALRFPMIILHLLSGVLLYKISKAYLQNRKNRLWLLLIFVLLPGVISSAIIVESAGLIIFGLLFFVYAYENFSRKYIYLILSTYVLISGEFVYLFLALSIFSIYTKQRTFFIYNMFAFFISLFIYGVDTKGIPQGHFLDSIAVYTAIFTPIIFIYIFYILYRRYLTKQIDILWFISSVAFVFSLLLSFRQRIELEHFAPYLILALPLAAQTFYHSYRVRLKIFRTKYRVAFVVSLVLLMLNSLVVFFNKEIYIFIDNPQNHFAYNMHVAKELADELKSRGIECVDTDYKMSSRLKFYGVTNCNTNVLVEISKKEENRNNVTISYSNRPVYFAIVTKVNTN